MNILKEILIVVISSMMGAFLSMVISIFANRRSTKPFYNIFYSIKIISVAVCLLICFLIILFFVIKD